MQRYFVTKIENNIAMLDSGDLHHIKRVMRNIENDKVEIVCDQVLYLASLDQDLKPVILNVLTSKEQTFNITLAVAMTKESSWNMILTKATELGVTNIIPLNTKHSVVKVTKDKITTKLNRWWKITKEAAEQSKRLDIPTIFDIIDIEDLNVEDYDLKFYGGVNSTTKLNKIISHKNPKNILIVIGPEGGFTAHEESEMESKGINSISLNPNILRAETAVICALSIINYELME